MRFLKSFSQCVVAAGVLLAASSAFAATVSCPGTASTSDREFGLTTSTAATCLASGTGNINGNGDDVNNIPPGYTTLDKSDDNTTGLFPNALTITGSGTTAGSFSFTAPAGFTSFVLAFKSGEGVLDPDWAAFLLPDGVTSGTWTISGNQSLSHANLYGLAAVPIPGAVWLFGTGLAGLALLRRRNGRRSQAA